MIRLEVTISNLTNEASELIRAFFPKAQVDVATEPQFDTYDFYVKCHWQSNEWQTSLKHRDNTIFNAKYVGEMQEDEDEILYKRRIKGALKETVYGALKEFAGHGLPYGMLTGVRPLTVVDRILAKNSREETKLRLMSELDISEEKAQLLIKTAVVQSAYKANADDVSLYVHVPFCVTRCNYCSFPSELIDRVRPYLDDYMSALRKEVEFIEDNANGHFEAMYVGGGTPTALPHKNFEELCDICSKAKTKRNISEFTIEAGRPDTIDITKLQMMQSAGVTRISINPQTMNDATLMRIGRQHTSQDIVNAYELARKCGFDNINMDLIVGLSGETLEDVKKTIDKVISLKPDGITVHVLALKHASVLNRDGVDIFEGRNGIDELLTEEYEKLYCNGYMPYYLYRQKYMLGGLENVGFAREGSVCRYNIRMMDNSSTCWAAGAGSISKRCYGEDLPIERSANPKDAYGYINGVEACIEKKRKIMF